jgi:hypothetical protein
MTDILDRHAAEERFRTVFSHLGAVAAYARRRGSRDVDALAAEVMTIAWRRLTDVRRDDSRPWLYATARNLVLAEARRSSPVSTNAAAGPRDTASPPEVPRRFACAFCAPAGGSAPGSRTPRAASSKTPRPTSTWRRHEHRLDHVPAAARQPGAHGRPRRRRRAVCAHHCAAGRREARYVRVDAETAPSGAGAGARARRDRPARLGRVRRLPLDRRRRGQLLGHEAGVFRGAEAADPVPRASPGRGSASRPMPPTASRAAAPAGASENWIPTPLPTVPVVVYAHDGGLEWVRASYRQAAAGDIRNLAQSCRANR